MVKFQTRLMVAVFVLVDVLSTVLAWVLAYFLRFKSDLVLEALPATKGVPALSRYLVLIPVLVLLSRRRLIQIDSQVTPASQIALTERVALFAPLSLVAKERIASHLLQVNLAPAEVVFRAGEIGDRFYIVGHGEVDGRLDLDGARGPVHM